MLGRSACRKFSRLSREADDRDLSPREQKFLENHRRACEACSLEEHAGSLALNMLRDLTFSEDDLEISAGFDERILRQVQVNVVREGIRYWSPAAIGAGIACVALFAALHVAATPAQIKPVDFNGGQARLLQRDYPILELERIPEFRR